MENLPDDWDYIHFDNVLSIYENHLLETMKPYSDYYNANYTGGYYGTGMVGWGTKAMELGVQILEHAIWATDFIVENRDNVEELKYLKRYASTIPLVHQYGEEPRYHANL